MPKNRDNVPCDEVEQLKPFQGRRRFLLACVLTVCATIICVYKTRIGKTIMGFSTVVVANDSGSELRDVHVILSSKSLQIERTFQQIRSGQEMEIIVWTSDLYPRRLDFVHKGNIKSHMVGGIACRGEELILTINNVGDVRSDYRW